MSILKQKLNKGHRLLAYITAHHPTENQLQQGDKNGHHKGRQEEIPAEKELLKGEAEASGEESKIKIKIVDHLCFQNHPTKKNLL